MFTRHLLKMSDLASDDIIWLLEDGKRIKRERQRSAILSGKTLGLMFSKQSTRTRISFEAGMHQLGGSSIYIDVSSTQLNRGESIQDTAKVLSSYLDIMLIRTNKHDDMRLFAEHSSIPVISGLSDIEHPTQVLADLLTISEIKPDLERVKLAYIGDGNNVARSLIVAAAKVGMSMILSSPLGYEIDSELIEAANRLAPGKIESEVNPEKAIESADFVYTDVWVSMGDEDEQEKRLTDFKDYQINQNLLSKAKKNPFIMHCLPAHRGVEITDQVIDGAQSIVFRQAENRLHMNKSILLFMLG